MKKPPTERMKTTPSERIHNRQAELDKNPDAPWRRPKPPGGRKTISDRIEERESGRKALDQE